MHAKIFSATTVGVSSHSIEVEVDLSFGLVNFCIVGLPDKAIKESKDRIRAALKNSGLRIPERLITVNLAPAHLKKQDTLFDVPIAIAILQAAKLLRMTKQFIDETIFLGELSLDGSIRKVCGVLAIVHGALDAGKKRVIVPVENCLEASLIDGVEIIGVKSLVDLVGYLRGEIEIKPSPPTFVAAQKTHKSTLDFSDVKGHFLQKKMLQIAAAGGHNILLIGAPGCGKTMLAKRLPTIMPSMSFNEVIETTKVYSVAGMLQSEKLIFDRPFRSPHHIISQAGLVGGGSFPRPGEISLAHNGVLFLDEMTEFQRGTLEVLRQPLEDNSVLISRANCSVEFPSSFLMVGALNPCPCGYMAVKKKNCRCSQQAVEKYFGKLSGPLIDRLDIHIHVPSINYDELKVPPQQGKTSAQMRVEVDRTIQFQRDRQGDTLNASLSPTQVEKYCVLTSAAEELVQKVFERIGLSMRAYHKVLKLARTLADFDGSQKIDYAHIRDGVMNRCLDRKDDNPRKTA
ncbi:YifB family Mg chelatase-like AAA ATPase [bacterium]|jgi:magnesium chelatase family protein|nr:YifB family Mg chelatase-like AAA ATPase [bacterium]